MARQAQSHIEMGWADVEEEGKDRERLENNSLE